MVKQAALRSLEVDEPSRVMVGPHPAAGPGWRCVQVDPLGACHRGGPYTAPGLLFHPQRGSLALPALRPASCKVPSTLSPEEDSAPRAVCGTGSRRGRDRRGEEAAGRCSVQDSGKSRAPRKWPAEAAGLAGQRTGGGSAPPRTKREVETQHPHPGAGTCVSDLTPSSEPGKSSG